MPCHLIGVTQSAKVLRRATAIADTFEAAKDMKWQDWDDRAD